MSATQVLKNEITLSKLLLGGAVLSIFVVLLTILLFYMLGILGADTVSREEYNRKTKENEKIVQTALAAAEKSRLEAEAIQAKNRELQAKYEVRDKDRDEKIKKSDEEKKKIDEKINSDYNADLNRISDMSDDERAADICARYERLARDNPALAALRCQ